jgi:two-component system chemotaxis response regulator CheY
MLKLRALVAEDCAVMRRLLLQMLPMTGLAEFRFVEAEDGAEAVARFHPEKIDIIFVDCNMPRLGGIEFVRKVRSAGNNAHIPIVMVSGVGTMGSVQEALDEAGANLYIMKPYTIDELRRKLAPIIEKIEAHRQTGAPGRSPGLLGRLIGNSGS